MRLNLEVGGVAADLRAGAGLHAVVEQNVGDDEEHDGVNAQTEKCGSTAAAGDEVGRLEDALGQTVYQAECPRIEDGHSEHGSQQRTAGRDLALLLAIVEVTLGERHGGDTLFLNCCNRDFLLRHLRIEEGRCFARRTIQGIVNVFVDAVGQAILVDNYR